MELPGLSTLGAWNVGDRLVVMDGWRVDRPSALSRNQAVWIICIGFASEIRNECNG